MEYLNRKKIAGKLTNLLFYFSILFFLIAFNFRDSMTGGWVQQFLPSLPGNPPLQNIKFTDSLTGYAITQGVSGSDSSYILKTTNGGNNWFVIRMVYGPNHYLNDISFINNNTGFISCDIGYSTLTNFIKTTNGGLNWSDSGLPWLFEPIKLHALNADTIWLYCLDIAAVNILRTTNGGANWQIIYTFNMSNNNESSIYFYNRNIGFVSYRGGIYKTIDGGFTWTQIPGENDFTDIYFIDSLRGYKAKTEIKKTTNGGLNWQAQVLPNVIGGLTTYKEIDKFSYINDTMYGVHGTVRYPNLQVRGIVYKTFNGGSKWGYQIPDTSIIRFPLYSFTDFSTSKIGWCYIDNGIYTNTGGDSTIMTNINSTTNILLRDYKLYQNYPNPFNQSTIINVQLQISKHIKIEIFDITGKQIATIVNKKETSGSHNYKFDGGNLSSGIYFYTLFVDGVRIDTKKMALIK